MSLIHDPIDEEDYENPSAISECCHAPILGQVTDDLGICSQCREWSGVIYVGSEDEGE